MQMSRLSQIIAVEPNRRHDRRKLIYTKSPYRGEIYNTSHTTSRIAWQRDIELARIASLVTFCERTLSRVELNNNNDNKKLKQSKN